MPIATLSAASAGRMEISGESTAAFMSIRGFYVPEKWDVYWTIRSACHKAYESKRPGQLVNCIPGVQAMSLKRNFLQTWQQVCAATATSGSQSELKHTRNMLSSLVQDGAAAASCSSSSSSGNIRITVVHAQHAPLKAHALSCHCALLFCPTGVW
jgi:hypothetical protein